MNKATKQYIEKRRQEIADNAKPKEFHKPFVLPSEEEENHYRLNRNIKRDWHICPRCIKRAVSKDLRKCCECGGRLAWQGDDCAEFNRTYVHYFIWLKSIRGLEAWYDKSYGEKQ